MKNEKAKKYSNTIKIAKKDKISEEYPAKDYSRPDDEFARRHSEITSSFRPNSEIPGNDR